MTESKTHTLLGQWDGTFTDADGEAWSTVVNVDQDRPFTGRILMLNRKRPEIWQHATLSNIVTVDRRLHANIEFSDYPVRFPGDEKEHAETAGTFAGGMSGDMKFVGMSGVTIPFALHATLASSGPARTTGLLEALRIERRKEEVSTPGDFLSWREFRSWIGGLPSGDDCPWIFRGQRNSAWPLVSLFHRHPVGRRDIIRFRHEDLPRLQSAVNEATGRTYRLDVRQEYEALLSIAQHHDYPTPLLDWTESPHIAAYFALRHREASATGRWRIYAFNATKFIEARVMSERAALEAPHLYLYIVRASQLDNLRARAQKSVFMLSSVADIEWFADQYSVPLLLRRFDLPADDAAQALSDLWRLGITESSLFPPDSYSSQCAEVCTALKDEFFASAP